MSQYPLAGCCAWKDPHASQLSLWGLLGKGVLGTPVLQLVSVPHGNPCGKTTAQSTFTMTGAPAGAQLLLTGRGGNACHSFTKQQGSRPAQLLARVSRAAWFGAASPLHPSGSTNQCKYVMSKKRDLAGGELGFLEKHYVVVLNHVKMDIGDLWAPKGILLKGCGGRKDNSDRRKENIIVQTHSYPWFPQSFPDPSQPLISSKHALSSFLFSTWFRHPQDLQNLTKQLPIAIFLPCLLPPQARSLTPFHTVREPRWQLQIMPGTSPLAFAQGTAAQTACKNKDTCSLGW